LGEGLEGSGRVEIIGIRGKMEEKGDIIALALILPSLPCLLHALDTIPGVFIGKQQSMFCVISNLAVLYCSIIY